MPLPHWLSLLNKRNVISASLVFLLGIAALCRFFGAPPKEDGSKYFQALTEFEALQHTPVESVVPVQQWFDKYPLWRSCFEGSIAKKLIAEKQEAAAIPYIRGAIEQDALSSPYYKEYAKNTLRVVEKQYEAALEQAQILKQELIKEGWDKLARPSGPTLHLFNLWRIALLSQELKSKEKEALQELKEYLFVLNAQKNKVPLQAFYTQTEAALSVFCDGNVSLEDYISYRETK